MSSRATLLSIGSNLVAFALPLVVGLICIPLIISKLGIAQFGFLSVSWAIVGYFSVFDLGLGRALTQSISAKLGSGKYDQIYSLTKKALLAMLVLSLCGASVLLILAPVLMRTVFASATGFASEANGALTVLAIGIPSVVFYSAFRGILESFGQFHLSALSRLGLGIWTFVSPIVVFIWSDSLFWVIVALVAGRYFVTALMAYACHSKIRKEKLHRFSSSVSISEILTFGGWMTVSNIISPIMIYTDRFFVSSISGLHAVTFYTVPQDFISRLTFIPEAVFSVLFPAMTRHHASGSEKLYEVYQTSSYALFSTMLLISAAIISASYIFLDIWVGKDFAQNSFVVMNVLAAGLFVNVMARPSYNLLQAKGHSNITAMCHIIEFPLYVATLLFAINNFGIFGAALCWVGRAYLDFLLLSYFANRDRSDGSTALLTMFLVTLTTLVMLVISPVEHSALRLAGCAFLAIVATAVALRSNTFQLLMAVFEKKPSGQEIS